MREIGSEFWDVPIGEGKRCLFPSTTQFYLSGRSALMAVLADLKDCHTVSMPSWCCDSMIKPFADAGFEIRFYPVYFKSGKLVQEPEFSSDVLFLMDYFGYVSTPRDPGDYHGVIIRDVTHSVFSEFMSDADYYFGSLRKWCGFWTGGYAWSGDGYALVNGGPDSSGFVSLRQDAMRLKESYINAQSDSYGLGASGKEYLQLFREAEELLESTGIASAAERDVRLAHMLAADDIKSSRRRNAEILRQAFTDWLIFPEMGPADCPMFVPVLVPDGRRDELRKYLIDHEIYCPVHWPVSGYHQLTKVELKLYNNELSLVCDQRYLESDMFRMVDVIRRFFMEG